VTDDIFQSDGGMSSHGDEHAEAVTAAGEEGDSALARFGMLAEELHLTKVTGRLTGVAGKVLEAQMPRATRW